MRLGVFEIFSLVSVSCFSSLFPRLLYQFVGVHPQVIFFQRRYTRESFRVPVCHQYFLLLSYLLDSLAGYGPFIQNNFLYTNLYVKNREISLFNNWHQNSFKGGDYKGCEKYIGKLLRVEDKGRSVWERPGEKGTSYTAH